MKARIVLFVSIFALISFSACSRSRPTEEGSKEIVPSPAATVERSPESTSASVLNKDQTTITFAVPSFYRENFTLLTQQFHLDNPDIFVQLVTPSEDIAAWVSTDLFSLASAADTTYLFSNRSLDGNGRFFFNLQPLIDQDADFKESDFWPGALSACRDAGGELLGIPLEIDLTGIAFDKSAFDRAGLPYPAPGWTWEDFERVLSSPSSGTLVYLDTQNFSPSILGPRIDRAAGNPDQLQEIVSAYMEKVQARAIYPYDADQTMGERQSIIAEQKPAMWSLALGDSFESEAGDSQESAIGFAPYPVGEEFSQTTPTGIRCGLISNGSQHPREAWRWLNYLARHWSAPRDQSNYLQLIPARIDVTEENGYWVAIPEELEPTIRFGLEHSWYGPSDLLAFQAAEQAIAQVLVSGGDFKSALSSAQQTILAQPAATPDPRIVVVAAPPPVQSEKAEGQIKFFSDLTDTDTLINLAAAFEDTHPLIKVKIESSLAQGIDVEYFTMNFDCFTGFNYYAIDNDPGKKAGLYPLDPLLALEPGLAADFFPGQLEQFTKDGVLFGLPAVRSLPTLTYNADLLEKAGIAAPSNMWSFNDFLSLLNLASSTEMGGTPTYGYAMAGDTFLLAGRGVSIGSTTPVSAFRFDQPEIVEAAAWLAELVKTRAVIHNPADDPNFVAQLVANGQVAFWDTSFNTWFFNNVEPTFPTGEIAMPSTPLPVGISLNNGFYISAHAENPKACWEWIRFLSSQPAASQFWPVRRSVAASPEWQTLVGSEKTALFQTVNERLIPSTPSSPERFALLSLWNEAKGQIYSGVSPEIALSDAQAKADLYFSCMESNSPQAAGNAEREQISQQCLAEIH